MTTEDPTKQAGDPNGAGAGDDPTKGKEYVPLWKLQKEVDKRKNIEDQLKTVTDKLGKFEQDKADAETDLTKKLETITAKATTLETENKTLKDTLRSQQVNSQILKAVSKHEPQDADDVLRFIDTSALSVEEKDGKVSILGLDEVVEDLKKSKPYLFGKTTKIDPKENGKPAGTPTAESLETEFRALKAKLDKGEVLSGNEKKRYNEVATQLKKIRAEKK